jgi:hypothetical protein
MISRVSCSHPHIIYRERERENSHLYSFTLWLFNIAMGNGPFIDGLPIKNCDFPGYVK